MKKIFIVFLITLIFSGVCMANSKIISSEPCEYRDVSCDAYNFECWVKDEITYEQMLEDLEVFEYLIKNAYSGYKDIKQNGYDFEKMKLNIPFSRNSSVKSDELLSFFEKELKPYICDFHFSLNGIKKQISFRIPVKIFFSDIYLEKENDLYRVIKSNHNEIKIDDIYSDTKDYLFPYPSEGINIYRLGVLSKVENDQISKCINVMFGNNKISVLCTLQNTYFHKESNTKYKEIVTEDSVYFYLPTLENPIIKTSDIEKYNSMYDRFITLPLRYKGKKNIIIDLRDNHGGNDEYCQRFLANLYFNNGNSEKNYKKFKKHISFYSINLFSPPVLQAMKWEAKNYGQEFEHNFNIIYKFMKRNNFNKLEIENSWKGITKKIDFTGKLILIIDKNTCSSGESFVYLANPLFEEGKNLYYLGENSAGCFNYGNVHYYQLPNSGITLTLASFKMEKALIKETVGYLPDYWATNDDIEKALVNITRDEELVEKLNK